ncbi:hypothetical protein F4805DRAFT_433471 [Annulohypoxylon moriforme]|nr:hypothetical protein F4805DRAFT_433471 [Annulohypoxylon moriforme]
MTPPNKSILVTKEAFLRLALGQPIHLGHPAHELKWGRVPTPVPLACIDCFIYIWDTSKYSIIANVFCFSICAPYFFPSLIFPFSHFPPFVPSERHLHLPVTSAYWEKKHRRRQHGPSSLGIRKIKKKFNLMRIGLEWSGGRKAIVYRCVTFWACLCDHNSLNIDDDDYAGRIGNYNFSQLVSLCATVAVSRAFAGLSCGRRAMGDDGNDLFDG